jgi:hypothetical protein
MCKRCCEGVTRKSKRAHVKTEKKKSTGSEKPLATINKERSYWYRVNCKVSLSLMFDPKYKG